MTKKAKISKNSKLHALGERGLLARLVPGLPGRADVLVGAGDDCAVVSAGKGAAFDWLLTSDPVVEGVHFETSAPDAAIGHKALARCLSDIAAMGGAPMWVLVNLVAPPAVRVSRIDGIYDGLTKLARRHDVAVVGGDVSAGAKLELHVFAVGRVPAGKAVLRSGALPGDALYVSGALGGSRQGRHLRFEPRLKQGQWLAAGAWATAMMDLSDGIAMDLPRLLMASRCGAELGLADIPLHKDTSRMKDGIAPLEHALFDGEDFELLFTVSRHKCAALEAAWRKRFAACCVRVGTILERRCGVRIVDADGSCRHMPAGGYEHFYA